MQARADRQSHPQRWAGGSRKTVHKYLEVDARNQLPMLTPSHPRAGNKSLPDLVWRK